MVEQISDASQTAKVDGMLGIIIEIPAEKRTMKLSIVRVEVSRAYPQAIPKSFDRVRGLPRLG
jgi:hypothetical protein